MTPVVLFYQHGKQAKGKTMTRYEAIKEAAKTNGISYILASTILNQAENAGSDIKTTISNEWAAIKEANAGWSW